VWKFEDEPPKWLLSLVDWYLDALVNWCGHGFRLRDKDWERLLEVIKCNMEDDDGGAERRSRIRGLL